MSIIVKKPSLSFPPPPPFKPDIYGLHPPSLLEEYTETETERLARIRKVIDGIGSAYMAAVRHLGESRARQEFDKVTRRPEQRRGGDKKKALAPDREALMLAAFDASDGQTPYAVAQRLWQDPDQILGSSVRAIEKALIRAIDSRTAQERRERLEAYLRRRAHRGFPPTLLGEETDDKDKSHP